MLVSRKNVFTNQKREVGKNKFGSEIVTSLSRYADDIKKKSTQRSIKVIQHHKKTVRISMK